MQLFLDLVNKNEYLGVTLLEIMLTSIKMTFSLRSKIIHDGFTF